MSVQGYQHSQDEQPMQYQLIPKSKWRMLQKLLKIPKSEYPDIWIRPPRDKWPKSWSNIEDPLVPLERKLYGHPLAGLLWERQFEKSSFGTRMGKRAELGMPTCGSTARSIPVCVTWMTSKLVGRKENLNPMWKKLMKLVDLGEPTSFLDRVYLGCTQRECKIERTYC